MVHHFLEGSHTGAKPQVSPVALIGPCETCMNPRRQFINSQHKLLPKRHWHQEEAAPKTRAIQGIRHSGRPIHLSSSAHSNSCEKNCRNSGERTLRTSSEMVWFLDDTEDIEDDNLRFLHRQIRWKNIMYLTQAEDHRATSFVII